MTALTDGLLAVADHNPLRGTTPERSWTIYRYQRNTDGTLDRAETGHEFTDYRTAEAYAEGLCNTTQVGEGFWFEAEEEDEADA